MSVTITVIERFRNPDYYKDVALGNMRYTASVSPISPSLLYTDEFEETSGTPTAHVLTKTAQITGAIVSFNGRILPPSKYIFTSSTIQIDGPPVVKGDTIVATYNHQL